MNNIEVSNELLDISALAEKAEAIIDELYQGYFTDRSESINKSCLINEYKRTQIFAAIAHDYVFELMNRTNTLMELLDEVPNSVD